MKTRDINNSVKSPIISVVIVTYNSERYIEVCVRSVLNARYKSIELLVVDNASTDGTLAKLHAFGKKIRLFALSENKGYTGGNNYAAKHARGTYLFFLNPDTKIDSQIFESLLAAIERDAKIAACQPAVYLLNNPTRLNLTGKVTHYLGFDWLRDYESDRLPKAGEILSLSGSGFLINRAIFQNVGAFDENFFLYFEDSDLSWRLRLFGYKLWFEPKSKLFHDYKYIPEPGSLVLSKKLYFYERNRLLMLWKNYTYRTLLILTPIIIFTELGMLVYCATQKAFLAKIRGYIDLVTNSPGILINRSFVQKNRIMSDAQVIKQFVSSIEFKPFLNKATQYVLNPIAAVYYRCILKLV